MDSRYRNLNVCHPLAQQAPFQPPSPTGPAQATSYRQCIRHPRCSSMGDVHGLEQRIRHRHPAPEPCRDLPGGAVVGGGNPGSARKTLGDVLRQSTASNDNGADGLGFQRRCVRPMMKYGDEWRAHRRLFNQGFTPKASLKYRPKQLTATHSLLQRLIQTPDDFMGHFRQWASEIIMSVAYGIDVLPTDDPYVALAFEAVHTLSNAGVPGKYLVDSLPLLKYVPAWLPGAGFKRKAKGWRKLAKAMQDVPFAETKRQIDLGTAPPSFTADSLHALKDSADRANYYTESTVKATAGTMYVGGADTSVSALGTFVLGMIANPDAQRKAQAEVDAVTGGRCLPTHADEAAMPYVAALVQEILRWKNVGPIAIPHFLAVEDEYKGYRIPANSLVIGNTWAILHDETVYPDPYAFKPERFLLNGKINPDAPFPETAFGFGRRLCPGRHMALSSLWIVVASILATFDIKKARDEHGREIEPSYEFDSGFINSPLPFKCCIRPRSQVAVDLIQTANAE